MPLSASEQIRLEFLRDLAESEREARLTQIAALAFDEQQLPFVGPPPEQIQAFREQPARDTFAIIASTAQGEQVIGVGSLHLEGADGLWPPGTLLYRGLVIDPAWQGRGVGSRTTELVLAAAAERYPQQESLVLAVHVDNPAGKRAYEKNGFVVDEGTVFRTEKGDHHVMRAPIASRR